MVTIRVHTDGDTKDFGPMTRKAAMAKVNVLATIGIWMTDTKFYPASRIVYIEILELECQS